MRKHRKSDEEVSLNVTAMLDMAFQLLAFFVLTFKPPPGEAQIYLKLPPAQPVLGMGAQAAGEDTSKNPKDVKTTKSLVVTLLDNNGSGSIDQVMVGVPSMPNSTKPVPYNELEHELRGYFKAKDENDASGQAGNALGDYEQVVINSSPTLRWEEVMKVVDLTTKFTTAKGDKIPAVSLSVAGEDPGG